MISLSLSRARFGDLVSGSGDAGVAFDVVEVRDPVRAQFAMCETCGSLIDVRINHAFGQLEERCPTCGGAWKIAPRRIMPAPEPVVRAPRMSSSETRNRRERVLAAIPFGAELGVTTREISELSGFDYYRVEADLRRFVRRGVVAFERRLKVLPGNRKSRRLVEVKFYHRVAGGES